MFASPGCRPCAASGAEPVAKLPRVVEHVAALVLPRLGERQQQPLERRPPVAVARREVGAAEEGHAVGREEHRQRPAAVLALQLQRLLVDLIDVGHLLAVDLDADEALVHQARGLRVLERLVRHHVTPVTGGVADREQDRLVLVAGARLRLVAPRVPVDRIVGVLAEVRRRFVGESIGHGPSSYSKIERRGGLDVRSEAHRVRHAGARPG